MSTKIKRGLALLMAAFVVLLGIPFTSYAVTDPTPVLSGVTGTATGTTTGNFSWNYSMPAPYVLQSASATLNGNPQPINIASKALSLTGLTADTNYELAITANYSKSEKSTFAVTKSRKTVDKVTTYTDVKGTLYVYQERHNHQDVVKYNITKHKPSAVDSIEKALEKFNNNSTIISYEKIGDYSAAHDGWRSAEFKYSYSVVSQIQVDVFKIPGSTFEYTTYEAAKAAIVAGFNGTSFDSTNVTEDNAFTGNTRNVYITGTNNYSKTATGSFKTNEQTYTVIFKIDGIQIGETQTIKQGADASEPSAPARTGYTFGWDKEFKNVQSDLVVNGVYTIKKYDVNFVIDGITIDTQEVNHGVGAIEPSHTDKEGYTFAWDKDFSNITEDTTVTGNYTILNYEVVFKIDGEVIDTQSVPYENDATDPGHENRDGYTFSWDKGFTNIKGDTTVNGIYALNQYFVKFMIGDEQIGSTQVVSHGAAASYQEPPVKAGHTFAWTTDYSNIQSNLTVYGVYTINKYDVIFKIDGEEVSKQTINYDGNAVDPGHTEKEGYTFAWDTTFNNIQGNLTVSGIYTIKSYTVQFYDYNESPIGEPQTVNHGSSANAPSNPSRSGYTFKNWSADFSNITGDLNVMAVYTQNEVVVPPTTEAPSQEQPVVQPTTQPATQPTTVDVPDEAIAEGNFSMMNFDTFLGGTTTPTEVTTEVLETLDLGDEDTPLGPTTLPKTGQLPVELFYGIGGLITAAGVFLKKKN